MNNRREFFENIKHKLFARRDELNAQLVEQSNDKITDDVQGKDSADDALTIAMESVQNSVEHTGLDELKLIEDAIIRLDRSEYGVCMDCSEPISQQRLEYYPFAARCIVCQEAFEDAK